MTCHFLSSVQRPCFTRIACQALSNLLVQDIHGYQPQLEHIDARRTLACRLLSLPPKRITELFEMLSKEAPPPSDAPPTKKKRKKIYKVRQLYQGLPCPTPHDVLHSTCTSGLCMCLEPECGWCRANVLGE